MGTKTDKPKPLVHIRVVLAIVTFGKRCLVTQRIEPQLPDAHLRWQLPGGKPEPGESSRATAIREVLEETGWEVAVIRRVPRTIRFTWEYPEMKRHTTISCYQCEPVSRISPPPTPLRWVKLKDIESLDVLPGTLEFVRAIHRPPRSHAH